MKALERFSRHPRSADSHSANHPNHPNHPHHPGHRTVFVQLVIGSLAVLAGVAALWLIANSFFLRRMDSANERRWLAGAVANQLLQVRLQEEDFLIQAAGDSAFYVTGDAPILQDHRASLGLVNMWVDSLSRISKDTTVGKLYQSVKEHDANFRDLVTTVRSIGSANGYVLGDMSTDTLYQQKLARMYDAISEMDPILADIIVKSVRDSKDARSKLIAAAPLIMVVGIIIAVLFFYVFAAGVSRMTTALEDAANDIGEGKFDSRVKFRSSNELGRLGVAFNRMAENLANLVGAVRSSSAQINSSTMEMAATSKEQQATAAQIAVTTSEVGVTAKEISATSQELANTVKQVASVADETAALAGEGQTGLNQLDTTIREVSQASQGINDRLIVLSEKAEAINSIITTIVKVADQTNLLSLNAAIEAEKAGEYGRGFAVVATEIRRLADQTAAATANIEQIIKEMQEAVTSSVMSMDQFSEKVRHGVETGEQVGAQLSGIIQKVQALAPYLDTVDGGMQSQAQGAQQISDALAQLISSIQQTAESLAQSSNAIEQLNDVAQSLQAGVSRFSVQS